MSFRSMTRATFSSLRGSNRSPSPEEQASVVTAPPDPDRSTPSFHNVTSIGGATIRSSSPTPKWIIQRRELLTSLITVLNRASQADQERMRPKLDLDEQVKIHWRLKWTLGEHKLFVDCEEPRIGFTVETTQVAHFFEAMMKISVNLDRENFQRLRWSGEYAVQVNKVVPIPERVDDLERTGLIFEICIVKESSLSELDHSA